MPKSVNQKLKLLYLIKIFNEKTDEGHCLTAQELIAELAKIPIVALSANTFDEDRKQSAESGMNAHLSKPLNTDQLLEFLAEII